MRDVVVPTWGLTMEDAVLIEWLCKPGDGVVEGQSIAIIETDKAEGEVESPTTGRVAEILASIDDEVQPGQVIARIDPSP